MNSPLRLLFLILLGSLTVSSAQTLQEMRLLTHYEFGRNRSAWNALESQLRNPLQRERDDAEETLIKVLTALESTTDARILACRSLRRATAPNSTQMLLSLIRDSRLSQEACLALQEKESADINPLMREALPLVDNNLKGQLMATLGRRRDTKAVPTIAKIAQAIQDRPIQETALHSLGQIGGKDALKALSGLQVSKALAETRSHALLSCASRSLKGSPEDAASGMGTLRRLAVNPKLDTIRLGAIYAWAEHDPSQRIALCRQALESRNNGLLEIAPKLFKLLDADDKQALYGGFFDGLGTTAKTLLIDLWDPGLRQVDKIRAISLNIEENEGLRAASLRALDRIQE